MIACTYFMCILTDISRGPFAMFYSTDPVPNMLYTYMYLFGLIMTFWRRGFMI